MVVVGVVVTLVVVGRFAAVSQLLPLQMPLGGGGVLTVIRPESIELAFIRALSVTNTFALRTFPDSPEGRTYAKLFEDVSMFATIILVLEL